MLKNPFISYFDGNKIEMTSYKKRLGILLIISLLAGFIATILSVILDSFTFLLISLPNFSLAAFFGYRYWKYDNNVRLQGK
jgi:hypothetical protein